MTTTFTSDGFVYELQPLKVRESRRVQLILARVLAPVFTESPNLTAALGALTEQDLDTITNIFGAACTFEDNGANFRLDKALDKHFQGRPMAYWRWLAECVRAEYSEYFLELKGLLQKLRQIQTLTPSESPQASTGTSGE